MNESQIQVLLVEDNAGDARLIQEFLSEAPSKNFSLEIVRDLSAARARLIEGGIDTILLDLHIPGSNGLDSFNSINLVAPTVPIVILTGMADETLAKEAIAQGAQDYLVKGRIIGDLVLRSINYSIERKKREEAYTKLVESLKEAHLKLQELSVTDTLTSLSNRRGFETEASQFLKIVKRNRQYAYLFFIDIDDMKWINDNLGHNEGDAVLVEVSNILKRCFRDTDIISRLGGDEFIALVAMNNAGDEKIIVERLQGLLSERNSACQVPHHPFFLSIGGCICDLDKPVDLETLLGQADKMMYFQKGLKRKDKELNR